ncbi:Lipoprotein-anchoring transpeptidase ErfK/SrfK [Rhizobiales bacterium GAS191]|nr:Lipoprotein-anchoring transpeptidase ErfK/SrfK [Rhizobiales bacterium GAS188]SEE91316.1 Lipoprotein-anchoring transpeptidase ErfK/SrfK [Rhizobiales bacterium GAS191]
MPNLISLRQGLARLLPALALPIMLSACVSNPSTGPTAAIIKVNPTVAAQYAALPGEPYEVPAVDVEELDPGVLRQSVEFRTSEPVGTIVIDTQARYLYLVQEGGKAMRYGVGVGKEGLAFKGSATIGRKAEWPHWTPTPAMIRREPQRYGPWSQGMNGGIGNPLGARAMYLYRDGSDTLFRIHGTNEPWTIGQAVSSGCIRMINQDVIDLFGRVPGGSRVVVL